MKVKSFSKHLARMLVIVMIVTMMPVSAYASLLDYVAHDDYYKVITKDDYQLAPGIVESEIVLNNAEGSHRQVAHVVEVDPNNPYTKVMPSYKGMAEGLDAKDYGTQIMSEQVAYAEANGYGNVVAAMNLSLSWYNSDYYSKNPQLVGEPLGYLVMDGKYYENSAGKTSGAQTVLVINFDEKDGVARPADIPKTEIRSTSTAVTGWEEQVIPANFGFLVKDGVNQYKKDHSTDAASRSFVGIKADGTIIMVMNDGRQAPYSTGFNSYEMAEFMLSLGCVQAINGDGGGSSQFLSQRPGEEMELHCSPSDGSPRATTHGILVISTAPATGEFVRAQVTTDDQYYTPNSSVQFDAVGTDLVGTPADIPADAKWQLTDATMGTIDDNGLFVSNGKTGEVTAQLVYNEEVVGQASINIVVPDISFKQATLVIPYNETAELSLNVTTNEGLNTVTTKEGDIVFTLSDPAMGTIEGNTFKTTADTSVKGGTITAVVCGDTENAITATVKFGKASEILMDFENNYELVIDESLTGGDDDADTTKKYYYGWHMGDIRIDQVYGYRWTGKKSYPTTIGVQMGKDMYVVDESTGMVRNGENALAVNVDWTSVTSMGSKQMNVWFPEPIDASEATSVGMWMYIPDVDNLQNSLSLRWCGYKKDGTVANITTQFSNIFNNKQGFSDEGWYYVSVDAIANNLATVEYFQFIANDASASYINPMSEYTFYIDDVTVDYSDATIDRENPYFTNVTISNGDEDVALTDGYVTTNNVVTLFAQATENMAKNNYTGLDRTTAKVTIDGVEVNEGVSINAGGKISLVDHKLSNGVHTVCFEVRDGQGNVGSVTRKLVVGTDKGDVHFELANPDYKLLPAGSVMYLNLVAEDIANIDSVVTKVRLDGCNDWDLEGMEVPYGFEASYTVNANNEAVITIERASEEVANTNVLAKLPVRVWMTSTYLNPEYIKLGYVKDDPALQDKYYALTPYAMWLSDGVSIMHIFMDASEGIVTYTDGTTDTFSSEEYEITTELNRYRNSKNNGDVNFYQEKASFHIHKAGEAVDKAATCTEPGYEDRVFCIGCTCDTVKRYNHECDTHEGCGSVIDWGTTIKAKGHNYEFVDGKLACECGKLFNGVHTDGKTYADGVAITNTWVGESYYVDGEMLTGVHVIDGKYYNFGEDGICANKYPMSAEWWTNDKGESRYFNVGVPVTGYNMINGVPTYFDENGIAFQGEIEINGETCVFERGAFVESTTADVLLAGMAGPKAYFILYADGTMVLCGEGATYDYSTVGTNFSPNLSWKNRPWGKQDQPMSKAIKHIIVKKDITEIGIYSFYLCVNTQDIMFEEGSNLKKIGSAAFAYLPYVREVVLPEKVTTISNTAFAYCERLVNVEIPQDVQSISDVAFRDSDKVILNVAKGTYGEEYAKKNNISYVTRAYVYKPIASGMCGENATWDLYGNGKLVIGGSGAMDDYTSQGKQPWAEYRNKIKEIVIGKDITHIGQYAFGYSFNVKSVEFEEGSKLESVGAVSFYYLVYVKEIVLPETVETIGHLAFAYSENLASVYVPQKVENIAAQAFANSGKVVLNVAEGTYAEEFAKKYNVSYTVRPFVESVVAEGVCGQNATWTLYESGKLVIGGSGAMDDYAHQGKQPWAEYRNKIKEIVIGKNITHVGQYAFGFAFNVKSVEFEEGSKLESIGAVSFYYMVYVKGITLPETVKTIGHLAFAYSENLASVYIPQKVENIAAQAFTNSPKVVLNVAEGTYAEEYARKYSAAYTTRPFVESVVAEGSCGENVTWTLYESGKLVIDGNGAMDDYASQSKQPWASYRNDIKEIIIGKDVTHIGQYAFAYSFNVKSVKFEEGSKLESIGAVAFYYMLYTEEITLPNTVKNIGNLAFGYCQKLESINYPMTAKVHANAFKNTPFGN